MLTCSCAYISFKPKGTYFGTNVGFGISSSQHICLVDIFEKKKTVKEMLDALSKLEHFFSLKLKCKDI
jgi:hypothetical protein